VAQCRCRGDLAVARCRRRAMLMTALPSHASNGPVEEMLVMVRCCCRGDMVVAQYCCRVMLAMALQLKVVLPVVRLCST
jgi:hypothetical protein